MATRLTFFDANAICLALLDIPHNLGEINGVDFEIC